MGAWKNYKMCVVTAYNEADEAPWESFDETSLSEALRAVQEEAGAYTWCSNPYIEHGAGNSRSN